MTTETTLRKRRALYRGEIGLFPTHEMATEDIALFTMDNEIMATLRSERQLKALNYLWGLVHKAQQNTDYWIDRYKAMDWFKVRVGFTKPGRDPDTREWDMHRPKSLKRINDNELRLLTERIIDVICQEILPGIKREDLRREVEEMFKERAA